MTYVSITRVVTLFIQYNIIVKKLVYAKWKFEHPNFFTLAFIQEFVFKLVRVRNNFVKNFSVFLWFVSQWIFLK